MDELEAQVVQKTQTREKSTLSTIEKLLNLHLAGFRQLDGFKRTEDNRREQAWLLLSTRAFQSLGQAYVLLQKGYYSQSLILARSAFEDWLACMDCKVREETTEALLSKERRVPTASDMANRLPDSLKNEWKGIEDQEGLYGFLSTFSHPRYRAAAVVLNHETMNLRIAPEYDETLFLASAYHIINGAMRIMEFISTLVANPTEENWGTRNLSVASEARKCLDKLTDRAKSNLASE